MIFNLRPRKAAIASAATVLVFLTACRDEIPTRPEELGAGSFAVMFQGVITRPRRVAVDEAVTGSACRIGEFIRLDNRSLTRRILIHFPGISSTLARYVFAYPEQYGSAKAHLNLGSDIRSVSSLNFVSGSATIVARSSRDALGTLEAQLRQEFSDTGLIADSVIIRGVFHATPCHDWRDAQSSVPSAP
jgi:hypothetical protein